MSIEKHNLDKKRKKKFFSNPYAEVGKIKKHKSHRIYLRIGKKEFTRKTKSTKIVGKREIIFFSRK